MASEQHSPYFIKDANGNTRFEVDINGNATFKDASGNITGEFKSASGNFIIKGRYLRKQ